MSTQNLLFENKSDDLSTRYHAVIAFLSSLLSLTILIFTLTYVQKYKSKFSVCSLKKYNCVQTNCSSIVLENCDDDGVIEMSGGTNIVRCPNLNANSTEYLAPTSKRSENKTSSLSESDNHFETISSEHIYVEAI